MDKLLTAGRRSLLPAIFGFLLLACTGHRDPELIVQVPPGATPATGDSIDLGTFLPSPHSLPLAPIIDKQASYSETDYVRYGLDYDTNVSHQNVDLSGDSVLFSPTWAEPANTTLGDLAFCVYRFVNISAFTRAPEVRYGWEVPPTEINTAWLGLADWDRDRWIWHQCNAEGAHELPALEPYTSGTDQMLVAVVVANNENPELRWIRLGPIVVDAQLALVPDQGIAPVTVEGRADGSTTLVGTLYGFEWDWDNDGVFEDDTGSTDTASHTYAAAGEHTATVRVTSSYGESATASAVVDALAPWAHTWGKSVTERLYGAAADDAGGLYFIGLCALENVLLLKYDITGEFIWAKSWPVFETNWASDIVYANEGLYVAGYTTSYGAGEKDAFLQRWDLDGNVEWTRTWGGVEDDEFKSIASIGDAVYCAGYTDSFTDPLGDGLVLKYDLNGNVQWARALGEDKPDSFEDIKAIWIPIPGTTSIHLVGDTNSYSASLKVAILYARLSEDGSLGKLSAWSDSDAAYGRAISVYGGISPQIFILGEHCSLYERILLTELGTGPGLVNKLWSIGWGAGEYAEGYDILRINDSLQVCGDGGVFPPDCFLVSFALDGTEQGAETWDPGDNLATFYFIQTFPGNGILLGGTGNLAAGGSDWSPVSGTLADATGAWSDVSPLPSISAPSGTVTSPTLAAVDVTGGVLDTGGGSYDALLIARDAL